MSVDNMYRQRYKSCTFPKCYFNLNNVDCSQSYYEMTKPVIWMEHFNYYYLSNDNTESLKAKAYKLIDSRELKSTTSC
jgi:hypothetical protein